MLTCNSMILDYIFKTLLDVRNYDIGNETYLDYNNTLANLD